MVVVQKFGGTSVKDDESREKVLEKIISCISAGNKVAVVVSAMGRSPMSYATDTLINVVKDKCNVFNKQDMDLLMSCGENISAVLISSLLNSKGYKAQVLNASNCHIITDDNFSNAKVKCIDGKKILSIMDSGIIPVITGFQGITENGDITTLGRGGSDTTASLVGQAIKANVVEIYTDVNGVMTADPKICKDAKTIDFVLYDELFQMADCGAKVIHKEAAFVAKKANIELKIKNTFTDEKGTSIKNYFRDDEINTSDNIFTGIALLDNRVKFIVNTNEFNDVKLFESLSNKNISLDMINVFPNQNVFTINSDDLNSTLDVIKSQKLEYFMEKDCSKITVIGEMTGIPGIMNKVLNCLNKSGIKVYQTVDSLVSISVLVKTCDSKNALIALHKDLGLSN